MDGIPSSWFLRNAQFDFQTEAGRLQISRKGSKLSKVRRDEARPGGS